MRVECTVVGYEDNYIDVADRWTRSEYRALTAIGNIDDYLVWFHDKVTGCKLSVADEHVTDPQAVTVAVLDEMDLVLTGFVEQALFRACTNLRNLGNASGRVSFGTYGTATLARNSTTP